MEKHCRISATLKWVFHWTVLLTMPAITQAGAGEYCQWEAFNATCRQDEVIVMKSARYGRMRLGRCLTSDVYIGCSNDILQFMDSVCSGLNRCEIELPDERLHRFQICPKDIVSYLEADYECIKMPPKVNTRCTPGGVKLTSSSGFISSIFTKQTSLGSSRCPWKISVQPGQKVNLTLFDYSMHMRQDSGQGDKLCFVYATVREGKTRNDYTICGGKRREQYAYTSKSNEIEIEVLPNVRMEEGVFPNFMIKYEATGCPDIKAPQNGWVERNEEKIKISCNFTTQAWHLVCSGTSWVGEYKNCSTDYSNAYSKGLSSSINGMGTFGLVIAIFIGIILGVIFGVLMLCAVLIVRRKRRRTRILKTQMLLRSGASTEHPERGPPVDGKYGVRIMRGAEYGYTHVWELRNQINKDCTYTARIKDDAADGGGTGQYESRTVPICGKLVRKEHVYESPQMEKQQDGCPLPVPPYYHEFDASAIAVGAGECRQPDLYQHHHHLHPHSHPHPHRLAVRGQVDGESDDSLDDFDNVRTNPAQTHTPEGYQAVPLCQ